MSLVPRDDIPKGPHRDRISVGDPAACHLFFVQVPKQVDRRCTNRLEFLDEVAHRTLVETARGRVGVLVEASERLRIPTCEAKRAIREHPLGIRKMSDDFFYCPFAGRVGMQPTFVVNWSKRAHHITLLLDEKIDEVTVRYEGYVSVVVCEILIGRGTGKRRRHRSPGNRAECWKLAIQGDRAIRSERGGRHMVDST